MKVIGLMSGTSLDGIDAAIAKITGRDLDIKIKLLEAQTYPYPAELKQRILRACHNEPLTIAQLAQLDDDIAFQFAIAANNIQSRQLTAELIGSHGQTVYHRSPQMKTGEFRDNLTLGYSMQLGRGEVIANLTGIPTISNFRQADIAAGGQGAPLVSKIDVCLLTHPTKYRVVQNLGGIGNLTYLPPRELPDWESKICGWDTGPANVLIDLAMEKLTQGKQSYDRNGEYAARGKPCQELVQQWLEQDYFLQSPPKSTGRELFNQAYLDRCWQQAQEQDLSDPDWLATITELTVASIAHSYRTFLPRLPDEVLLCGGGSFNLYMRQRLQAELTSAQILTTDEIGLDGNYKEAIAFAILAYWRYQCQFPGNLPQVTSAKKPMLLGDIHQPQFSNF